jgi:hypothetical protein
MTSVDEIEQLIKPFLLTSVKFTVDDKIIKQGRLQLFCIKGFFCNFTILGFDKPNKKTVYEIPYPFDIEVKENRLILDYTVDSFCASSTAIRELVCKIKTPKTSKFFNKKIVVSLVNDTILE